MQNNNQTQADVSQLPHNRWQVFTDRLQTHFGKFLLLGLLLLLFSLPLFAVRFFADLLVTSVQESYHSMQITEQQFVDTLKTIQLFSALAGVVGYVIFGIGVMGVIRHVRKMAWSEPTSFWYDFGIGIKQNLGGLWCFLAMGVLNAFSSVCMQNYSGVIAVVPFCLQVLVLFPIILHIVVQLSIYNHKTWDLITTSSFIYLKTAPLSIVFSLLFSSYGLLDLIPSFAVKYLLKMAFVILLPIAMLGWFLYCCSALDKYVNRQSYPQIVDKGIWR